jgi:hypothetical protein
MSQSMSQPPDTAAPTEPSAWLRTAVTRKIGRIRADLGAAGQIGGTVLTEDVGGVPGRTEDVTCDRCRGTMRGGLWPVNDADAVDDVPVVIIFGFSVDCGRLECMR